MTVIPSLNCRNEECVREKTETLCAIGSPWVHVDVADGIFAPVVLSDNARVIKKIFEEKGYRGNIEVHLMVANPEEYVGSWLESGARRIIVHAEAISDGTELEKLKLECASFGAELGIAVKASTSEESLKPFLECGSFWTVLAVPIGFSGGVFEEEDSLKKISFLRKNIPDAVIEIDGGMNEKTGVVVKNEGANVIVSGTFIFSHSDPKKAFRMLENLPRNEYNENV